MKLSIVIICLILNITSVFSQKLGKHTLEEWQTIIDTTWGEGLPTATKVAYFDDAWNTINNSYACFQNLDIDWGTMKDLYRPQVAAGVSRGRFAAIMTYLGWEVQESHTYILDKEVSWNTSLKPGVPLIVTGSPGRVTHFGAALSPLPDSSLLVIKVLPDHPLGLLPGDVVLGYEGIPWKKQYKELLKAEFPLSPTGHPVSTPAAKTHNLLINAGMNWHLFDTLDVIKYNTGDTMHYPTDLLAGQTGFIWANEQLPVPGVPWVDINEENNPQITADLDNVISWGIVDGTQIGYIYLLSTWEGQEPGLRDKFRNAIDSLMHNYETSGLIIDQRLNIGGHISMPTSGLALLFNSNIQTVAFRKRCGGGDHFNMCSDNSLPADVFDIKGEPATFYDRPIAVLTGPGGLSMGDFIPLQMKFHPMSRFIGKPSAGAFSYFDTHFDRLDGGVSWEFAYTSGNTFLLSDPDNYLTHSELPIDEEIWLTQEDVAKGEDTVVKRAIEWIQNLAHAHDVAVDKTYIAPATGNVQISAQVENPNNHELSVLAYIANDTTVVDSVYLAQKDSTWSAPWIVGEGEKKYHVSVKTNDTDESTSRTIPNVAHFTSEGPVVIDSVSDIRRDPRYKTRLYFDIYLKNESASVTIRNVAAKLYPDTSHPCFGQIGTVSSSFGHLDPGETQVGTNFSIFFEGSCSGTIITIPIFIEISSDGYAFWSDDLNLVTAIEDVADIKLLTYKLLQNYPNPFNPKTMISYQLAMNGDVELSIYNILGQKVATLVNKKQPAGNYSAEWDASGFASGIYYYKLSAKDFQQVKKMVLIK